MRRFPREIEPKLVRAARAFPAIVLTGPRRAGKTFSLRRAFPRASYHLLEDPEVLARIAADPTGWLDDVHTPAILDEVQNVPDLFRWVRARIDAKPSAKGRWLLTGSQDFSLMEGVSESMAGRAAVFQMLPLSAAEVGGWDLLKGGFPEVQLRPRASRDWFRSYVQTYLERDVRAVTAVRNLGVFRRFLGLLAVRNGQPINRAELAAPLGVSVPTVSQWIDVLAVTGLVLLVAPWFESLGTRLVKTPRLYFVDTGLLAFLLGLDSRASLARSPLAGSLFEAFVASELVKAQLGSGSRAELWFYRDRDGLEVDLVVPRRGGELWLVEVKSARSVSPHDARAIDALAPQIRSHRVRGWVVHQPNAARPHDGARANDGSRSLSRHARAIDVDSFLDLLRR